MKRTLMEKIKGRQIEGGMNRPAAPGRPGPNAVGVVSRKQQRQIDQAAGLVAFAVKLPAELVAQLRSLQQDGETGMNELVADLLRKALR